MTRKYRHCCIAPLIWIAILLPVLEMLLAKSDPMAFQVRVDALEMISHAAQTTQGYQIPTGRYVFNQWIITIQVDGTRITPFTNSNADCEIIMLGDSVTFGYGVHDYETYTSQLALMFPDVKFINAAQIGYNSGNIRSVYETLIADGYVYMIVDNDWQKTWRGSTQAEDRWPIISYYAVWLFKSITKQTKRNNQNPKAQDIERFTHDIEPLFDDSRVLIASYGDITFTNEVDIKIPITSTIAPGDTHPDAEGHRDIARLMHEQVTELIENVCR